MISHAETVRKVKGTSASAGWWYRAAGFILKGSSTAKRTLESLVGAAQGKRLESHLGGSGGKIPGVVGRAFYCRHSTFTIEDSRESGKRWESFSVSESFLGSG
ncbi:uncharacterized protein G2W53_000864 [Senna tora]|uniref:Uncharacterized protein n=1 Tax=Senna tora TaxID=362788 RepID=A0A835CIX0_9FABA|nr:uncharacterized protein G2W53_000864 [Senna tora]